MFFSRLFLPTLTFALASAECQLDRLEEDVSCLMQVSTKVEHAKHRKRALVQNSRVNASQEFLQEFMLQEYVSQPIFAGILASQRSVQETLRRTRGPVASSVAKKLQDPRGTSKFGFIIAGVGASVLFVFWCAKGSRKSGSFTADKKMRRNEGGTNAPGSSGVSQADSDESPNASDSEGLTDQRQQSQHIWRSSFMFSDGWPQFWLMTLLGGFAEALCAFLAPDIAYAQLNNGHDPCQADSMHFNMSTCADATNMFIEGLLTSCVVGTFLAILCAPVVARLCDKYGRKPFIVARAVLTQIHFVTLLLIWYCGLSIQWFFITTAGLQLVPTLAIWNLYVADRVKMHERTAFFAVLYWCTSVDSLAVPLAMIMGSHDTCLWMAFCGSLGCLFFSLLLPESLTPEKRAQIAREHGGSYSESFWLLASDPKVQVFSFLVFIGAATTYGWCAVRLPWMKLRFEASDKQFAPLRIVQALSNLVFALFFTKPLTDYFGLRMVILLSWCAAITMDACYIAAPNLQSLYLQAPLESLSSLCCAAINACFINIAPPSKIAQVQAMFSQVISVAVGIGPVVYAFVMTYAMQAWKDNDVMSSNAPLFLDQVMCVVALVILAAMSSKTFPKHDQCAAEPLETLQ